MSNQEEIDRLNAVVNDAFAAKVATAEAYETAYKAANGDPSQPAWAAVKEAGNVANEAEKAWLTACQNLEAAENPHRTAAKRFAAALRNYMDTMAAAQFLDADAFWKLEVKKVDVFEAAHAEWQKRRAEPLAERPKAGVPSEARTARARPR